MKRERGICEDCDRVHPATKDSAKPYRWRCLAVPTRPGFGFVSRTYSPDPPYARCQDINRTGECRFWTPLRTPEEPTHGTDSGQADQ